MTFLRFLGRGLAKAGETTTARRLFRFCFDHATEAASPLEGAYTRIDEAQALSAVTPVEETRRLLEEGITLFENIKAWHRMGM